MQTRAMLPGYVFDRCPITLEYTNHTAKQARDLVMQSNGIEQTRALAEDYVAQAIEAIRPFPDSEAKDGLIEMAVKTLKRNK